MQSKKRQRNEKKTLKKLKKKVLRTMSGCLPLCSKNSSAAPQNHPNLAASALESP